MSLLWVCSVSENEFLTVRVRSLPSQPLILSLSSPLLFDFLSSPFTHSLFSSLSLSLSFFHPLIIFSIVSQLFLSLSLCPSISSLLSYFSILFFCFTSLRQMKGAEGGACSSAE